MSASRLRFASAAAALTALAVVASGCDVQENADTVRGKALFTQGCGSCHVLKEAGTKGTTGPNLDAAFLQSRRDGMDRDTVEGVVQRQIAYSRPASKMPSKIFVGQDAEDVAAYVAGVAGVPGIKANPLSVATSDDPGAKIFADQGCGSCHKLAAGGGQGATGPDLDKTLKGKDAAFVETAVVDPAAEIAAGFKPGIMPADYKSKLKPGELKALVEFLLSAAK